MKIEHIAMYVNDIEATKEFFVSYLGGKASKMYHNKRGSSLEPVGKKLQYSRKNLINL